MRAVIRPVFNSQLATLEYLTVDDPRYTCITVPGHEVREEIEGDYEAVEEGEEDEQV